MGGTDITSSAYTSGTGAISIASVSGNIAITATASANSQGTTYTITNSLTNCTNSNAATSIASGSSYSGTISASSGYTLSSVAVTMGGTDITSTAYTSGTGAISIASVSGNLVITASATASTQQNTRVTLTHLGTKFSAVYSDAGSTLLKDGSSNNWASEKTFDSDTVVSITVLYGTVNANLKQYAGSWDGTTGSGANSGDPYKVLYGEVIGSASTSAYTAQYTVKAGNKLFIKNYNTGTPEGITVNEVTA